MTLVDAKTIATHYSVKVETVHTWARQGRIPSVRATNRVIRFRLDDVERAIEGDAESKRKESTQP